MYRRQGRIEDSLDTYRRAADVTPQRSYPFVNLAMLYLSQSKEQLSDQNLLIAERNAQRKLADTPADYWALFDLALVTMIQNETEKSKLYIKDAIEVTPAVGILYSVMARLEFLGTFNPTLAGLRECSEMIDSQIGTPAKPIVFVAIYCRRKQVKRFRFILLWSNLVRTYFRVIRPRILSWGLVSDTDNADHHYHGDDLISSANLIATRTITINASPEEIWKWLAQMGRQRTGFYGIDRLDNWNIPSLRYIREDIEPLDHGMLLDNGLQVFDFKENRYLLIGGFHMPNDFDSKCDCSYLYQLELFLRQKHVRLSECVVTQRELKAGFITVFRSHWIQ